MNLIAPQLSIILRCLVLIASAMIAISGRAEVVTVTATGTFGIGTDDLGLFSGSGVSNGDPFSVALTYDPSSPIGSPQASGPTLTGNFFYGQGLTLNIGNKLGASDTHPAILLQMATPPTYQPGGWYIFFDSNSLNLNGKTMQMDLFINDSNPSDVTALGLSVTSLPTSAQLNEVLQNSPNIFFRISGYNGSGGYQEDANGEITNFSVQSVPEPSIWTLAVAGLTMLLFGTRHVRGRSLSLRETPANDFRV